MRNNDGISVRLHSTKNGLQWNLHVSNSLDGRFMANQSHLRFQRQNMNK